MSGGEDVAGKSRAASVRRNVRTETTEPTTMKTNLFLLALFAGSFGLMSCEADNEIDDADDVGDAVEESIEEVD